jgi:hypothetical protein
MALRLALGPVFWVELRAAAQGRRVYLARAALVAFLLAIPMLGMYMNETAPRDGENLSRTMMVFGRMTYSILAVALVTFILLGAPAAAAGCLGRDRSRGPLEHVLVTDLTAPEIVVGTAAARLAPVLFLVLAAAPVAVLEVVWFGTDPDSVLTLAPVALALALLGVTASAAVSLWARRAYEGLLAVYMLWAVWLLSYPVRSALGPSPPPLWLVRAHPYTVAELDGMLLAAIRPRLLSPADGMTFLAVACVLSAAILSWVALRLRAVARREPRLRPAPRASRPASRFLAGLRARYRRLFNRLPAPTLDGNPILWRECWHARRSWWLRAYWVLYALALSAMTALCLLEELEGNNSHSLIACAALGTGFGLLAVAVRSASAWSEERAAGTGALDVLLATPLSAAEIIRGKYGACYRPVLWVAVVPLIAALVLPTRAPSLPAMPLSLRPVASPLPLQFGDRLVVAAIVIAQPLVFGALVVSLGLWLATRSARPARAVLWTVLAYGAFAMVPPIAEQMFWNHWLSHSAYDRLAPMSPMTAATVTLTPLFIAWYGTPSHAVPYAAAWLVVALALAAVLWWWTVASFDRAMGRTSARLVAGRDPAQAP